MIHIQCTIRLFVHSRHKSGNVVRGSRADVTQCERDWPHLTELLRRCARLPEIGEARVNNRVFQNSDFAGHHVCRLQAGVVSRDECTEQGGHRDGRAPIRSNLGRQKLTGAPVGEM